jgi:hypothetical protein
MSLKSSGSFLPLFVNLEKIWPQICTAAEIFMRPFLCFVAEILPVGNTVYIIGVFFPQFHRYFAWLICTVYDLLLSVLRSRSRKEPHLLVGAGAGAVLRCGSGSDGSGSDNGIKHG